MTFRRLSIPLLVLLGAACSTALETIPADWTEPEPTDVRSARFAPDGSVLPSDLERPRPLADGPIGIAAVEGGFAIARDGKPVSPAWPRIDSLDLSEQRQEVVFSADRDGDLDIGLIAADGGEVVWLPDDPSPETAVQWAPRGHKVSYVIHAPGGDVVRTLHVPTSYQFSVGFPWGHIHDTSWDAAAEKVAVVYSSPDASARVEVIHYDGSERRIVVPPRRTAALTVEPAPGGVLLRPAGVRYDERLPLVVWVTPRVHEWSSARAGLVDDSRAACLVVPAVTPDVARLAAQPWVDRSRVFVVGASATGIDAVSIVGDPRLPEGRVRREGRVVSVSPAVVQSFAAATIAEELKRTSPPNGSSR